MAGHGQNLVIIGAAFDDHVDLDVRQTHGARRFNAVQHIGHGEVHIVHAAKDFVVQPIQADGDAVQARIF